MAFKTLRLQNLRCLQPGRIEFAPGLNFFIGANGSGKSSLVEACLIALTGRSFRARQLSQVICHHLSVAKVQAELSGNYRVSVELESGSGKSKRIHINEKLITSSAQLAAICPVQLISPESFHLVDSAPAQRRSFLDWLLFLVEHSYQVTWSRYQSALKQRNALLKSRRADHEVVKEIPYWNNELVEYGNIISTLRQDYTELLHKEVTVLLTDTDFDADDFVIKYRPGFKPEGLLPSLEMSFEKDRARGFTNYGCHKADLTISYQGNFVKDVFSRGQKKLLINLMFIAQLRLLKRLTDKSSVFMIDDFTSEMDEANQALLLHGLQQEKDLQIIATGLSAEAAKSARKVYNSGHMFHVEHGSIAMMQ